MKHKNLFCSGLLILLTLINVNTVLSQTTLVNKEMLELKPSKDLTIELRDLVNKVNACDYYSCSLIWNIGINQVENGCLINITMQETINIDYEYVGFFYLDKLKFVVSGVIDDSLFTKLEKKKLKFETKDKSENIITESPSGDYSNWIYLSRENKLMKVREYLLPCK